jgi:hypothetical protein
MNQKEIRAILGLDKSTISRILRGGNGYRKETINEVKLLHSLKEKYFDEIFRMPEFEMLCDAVIEKAVPRDGKDVVEIINFACLCKSKHLTLTNQIEAKTIQEILGKYYEDSNKLIRNELFNKMCSIAIKKEPGVRLFAAKLMGLSVAMQDIKRKVAG